MIRPGREVFCRGEESVDVSSTAYALPTPELVLDRYRPLRPIGRGGSGSVWLARDERTGLEVALKIVPREGKRASRAAREMEAASRLRHERCVRAYDFGGDSGHVYIAYEYVQGQTMREALRGGKLSDRDAIEAAAQILDALAHAHRLGIVHRDVKPSNVLVEEGPSSRSGSSTSASPSSTRRTRSRPSVTFPGTLAYIAPERLTGGDATTASDIWAVGVLLWESLAGEHPFWGVPLPQVAAAIESGAPPLAEARSDLPPAVADAVSSALAVDPTRRPSAERLARDLRAAVTSPRRDRTSPARQRKPAPAPKVAVAPLPLEQRLVPAGLAAVTVVIGATLLPFWTPGLTILLALAAALATLRSPRLGLAIALFVPVFPLGNVAQAAAVAYAALAVVWLAVCWRDARAGLLFMAGPGARRDRGDRAPPARRPTRSRARAPGAAGVRRRLRGRRPSPPCAEGSLPLTGAPVPSLGVDGSTSLADRRRPRSSRSSQANPWFAALATVLGRLSRSAARRPQARASGGSRSSALCQIGLILFLAPTLPTLPIVLGTVVLCAILAALTFQAGRYP